MHMPRQKSKSKSQPKPNTEGITRITVAGFKSISQEQSIEIRPLTILAGPHGSGKSSIMQPLLLLKQTLEASYDPGVLLLDGSNVKFTSVDQLLSHISGGKLMKTFRVGIEIDSQETLTTGYTQDENNTFALEQMRYNSNKVKYRLYVGMPQDEIEKVLSASFKANLVAILKAKLGVPIRELYSLVMGLSSHIVLTQNRCFLTLIIPFRTDPAFPFPLPSDEFLENYILKLLHLPVVRGNPERTYPAAVVGSEFPGTFEKYTASVIEHWQTVGNSDKLEKLNRDLARLSLTSKVIARRIDDMQIELLVNRFAHSNGEGGEDMLSIAEAGLGISQALPVVVALHAANQGQLLSIEQPESDLHPRAQSAMAEVVVDAVVQGARLVVETHSPLLLRGVQTLVAEGKLSPEMVKLHWFKLLDDGSTQITSADLDKTGAFGDWPEDFHTVTLNSESRYLDAAEARLMGE
jgi:predicted ATPase